MKLRTMLQILAMVMFVAIGFFSPPVIAKALQPAPPPAAGATPVDHGHDEHPVVCPHDQRACSHEHKTVCCGAHQQCCHNDHGPYCAEHCNEH